MRFFYYHYFIMRLSLFHYAFDFLSKQETHVMRLDKSVRIVISLLYKDTEYNFFLSSLLRYDND